MKNIFSRIMLTTLLLSVVHMELSSDVEIQPGIPVFPGAEGFGTFTPAGRGGKLIEVTSLADRGPGTLREALEDPHPRTIVFRIGGLIELKDSLFIGYPYVTIAGQSAPGDGITIKDNGIAIITHDVLIQHLRIRPGNEGSGDPQNNDAISVFEPEDRDAVYNVVVDHISASWAEDEVVSILDRPHDVTISNCIISEGLNRSRHPKGTHSAGLLVGYRSDRVSLHHSLFAHNDFRNPLIANGGTHDVRNNVIYNWGVLGTEISDVFSDTHVNLIANTYVPGPSTPDDSKEMRVGSPRRGPLRGRSIPKLFVQGNIGPRQKTGHDDFISLFHFEIDQTFPEGETLEENIAWAKRMYFVATPFSAPAVTTLTADRAMEQVLAQAGATRPKRDVVDERIVREVRSRTGRIIDSPREFGGYPQYRSGTPLPDGDHDGMPDAWEIGRGLDPSDGADGNHDRDRDGYTNLEEYLYEISK